MEDANKIWERIKGESETQEKPTLSRDAVRVAVACWCAEWDAVTHWLLEYAGKEYV